MAVYNAGSNFYYRLSIAIYWDKINITLYNDMSLYGVDENGGAR